MPLDGLLEVTASKEPVPGGGGIAAMTAASAAALVEMVANLTIGKKGYDEIEKLMVSIRDKAHGLRQRYLDGIAEDAAAFDSVIRAVRLPKDTPDRAAKVQQAFKDAALSPFELGKDIFVLLQLAEQVVRYGNAWVITDGVIPQYLSLEIPQSITFSRNFPNLPVLIVSGYQFTLLLFATNSSLSLLIATNQLSFG